MTAQSSPAPTDPSPSPWVLRFVDLIAPAAPVLDVACGRGRHARLLAARGHRVHAVDRDAQALSALADVAACTVADIESGPWPYPGQRFGAVVVTNYLWRPLLPTLVDSVDTGGVLLYETFALGNETVGRPSNPDFLLRPGELLEAVHGRLRVVAYEDGWIDAPKPAFVQRVCAVRERAPGALPARYNL